MNWVGGARSRLRVKEERKIQQQFFERKRQEKLSSRHGFSVPNKLNTSASSQGFRISQDLLSLQTILKAQDRKQKQLGHASSQQKPRYVELDSSTPSRIQHVTLSTSPSGDVSRLELDNVERFTKPPKYDLKTPATARQANRSMTRQDHLFRTNHEAKYPQASSTPAEEQHALTRKHHMARSFEPSYLIQSTIVEESGIDSSETTYHDGFGSGHDFSIGPKCPPKTPLYPERGLIPILSQVDKPILSQVDKDQCSQVLDASLPDKRKHFSEAFSSSSDTGCHHADPPSKKMCSYFNLYRDLRKQVQDARKEISREPPFRQTPTMYVSNKGNIKSDFYPESNPYVFARDSGQRNSDTHSAKYSALSAPTLSRDEYVARPPCSNDSQSDTDDVENFNPYSKPGPFSLFSSQRTSGPLDSPAFDSSSVTDHYPCRPQNTDQTFQCQQKPDVFPKPAMRMIEERHFIEDLASEKNSAEVFEASKCIEHTPYEMSQEVRSKIAECLDLEDMNNDVNDEEERGDNGSQTWSSSNSSPAVTHEGVATNTANLDQSNIHQNPSCSEHSETPWKTPYNTYLSRNYAERSRVESSMRNHPNIRGNGRFTEENAQNKRNSISRNRSPVDCINTRKTASESGTLSTEKSSVGRLEIQRTSLEQDIHVNYEASHVKRSIHKGETVMSDESAVAVGDDLPDTLGKSDRTNSKRNAGSQTKEFLLPTLLSKISSLSQFTEMLLNKSSEQKPDINERISETLHPGNGVDDENEAKISIPSDNQENREVQVSVPISSDEHLFLNTKQPILVGGNVQPITSILHEVGPDNIAEDIAKLLDEMIDIVEKKCGNCKPLVPICDTFGLKTTGVESVGELTGHTESDQIPTKSVRPKLNREMNLSLPRIGGTMFDDTSIKVSPAAEERMDFFKHTCETDVGYPANVFERIDQCDANRSCGERLNAPSSDFERSVLSLCHMLKIQNDFMYEEHTLLKSYMLSSCDDLRGSEE